MVSTFSENACIHGTFASANTGTLDFLVLSFNHLEIMLKWLCLMSPRFSIIKSSNTKSTAASTIKYTHTHPTQFIRTPHSPIAVQQQCDSIVWHGFRYFSFVWGLQVFFFAALPFLSWEIRSVLVYLWNVGSESELWTHQAHTISVQRWRVLPALYCFSH